MKARLSIPVALFFLLLVTSPASASVSNDQVQSQHIREADGTSGQNTNSGAGVKTGHIQNSAVTSAKIQDGQVLNADLASGAVTDAKISGVISATKLPVGTTSGTVAAGDHNHDNIYQKKYANVVVVAKSGGDFTDPIAAMASITDASATNPYLLKIMPGVYDLGSSALLMKQFVDIEGSGENATVITSSVICNSPYNLSTVNTTGNTELRLVTVRNTGTGAIGVAIGSSGQSMKLLHVTALASGATEECHGISCASGDLTDITAFASGGNNSYGISSGSCNMTDVTTTASGSTYLNVGLQINYASPTMNNVSASASGEGALAMNMGIQGYGSSPVMNNVSASGSGGYGSYGIRNIYESSPIMTNVTATASGATNNFGIEYYGSTMAVMINVTATGRNGTRNSGLVIGGFATTILLDRSTLEGSSSSIEISNNAHDLRIGASKLVGGIIGGGGGTLTCVASYNGSYSPLDANCQ